MGCGDHLRSHPRDIPVHPQSAGWTLKWSVLQPFFPGPVVWYLIRKVVVLCHIRPLHGVHLNLSPTRSQFFHLRCWRLVFPSLPDGSLIVLFLHVVLWSTIIVIHVLVIDGFILIRREDDVAVQLTM